jgi:CxxC motif-containing protein (DUF1111 family)
VRGALALTLFAVFTACGDDSASDDDVKQGGDLTVGDRTRDAFTHSGPTLSDDDQATAQFGRSVFNFTWAAPQLGRLFNDTGCSACHSGNGRGLSQVLRGQELGSQALVRVSLSTGAPSTPGGNVAVPGFGEQLQDHATAGLPEVYLDLAWIETSVTYGDGTTQAMRRPNVTITNTSGDPLPQWQTSYRQGPPVIGLGLLDAVPDDELASLEDPGDADGDGISGRRNSVFDHIAGVMKTGRFGHKANVATLVDQVAGAFTNDVGLSNKEFPEDDGVSRDLNDDQLDQIVFFVSTIAVPAAAMRTDDIREGRDLFTDMGCAGCHTPTLHTGDSPIAALANQTIHPYTDLLLHDVGDLLTDARSDCAATGVEWRTPPLWGIGLTQTVQTGTTFMHDGRARTLEEAILWHGGEAATASEAFRTADAADRAKLIMFLQSL